jgi:hypothetical protein
MTRNGNRIGGLPAIEVELTLAVHHPAHLSCNNQFSRNGTLHLRSRGQRKRCARTDLWRERLTPVSIGLFTRMLRKFARHAFRFRSLAALLCKIASVNLNAGAARHFEQRGGGLEVKPRPRSSASC